MTGTLSILSDLHIMSIVHSNGLREFQQNNATPHTSRIATECLPEHSSEFRRFLWPPKSPDMNIIEHILGALGGILEPEGTVEIRFRKKDLLKTMHRIDNVCKDILKQLSSTEISSGQKTQLEKQLQQRELSLLPIYLQVALTFADLHDTPRHMMDKGAIKEIIPWAKSRALLYWRCRRLLIQNRIKADILAVKPSLSDGEVDSMLERWFVEEHGAVNQYLWDDNKTVVDWLTMQLDSTLERSQILENIDCLRRDSALSQIRDLLKTHPDISMDSVIHIIQNMNAQQRTDVLNTIRAFDTQMTCSDLPLDSNINGDRYKAIITNFFIPELNNHDVQELWFQQDGATCHTARATIDLLKDTFGDRLISRFVPVNWPPRSCDLTPLDYFLWGYVKSLVYADKPQTLDHLEGNIRRVIADIRP
ncbi:acetyl-CoA carboxylase [Trichonephila clavipes]|uniref:Acetyl-CoA carboxylase n=1 Tax=Trichonephila clavipes TaxID=2585209 RepID=A0A8X6UTH9_TRICX|nr:acetyl-CoA carboxylase [Trichonephila clavipes]